MILINWNRIESGNCTVANTYTSNLKINANKHDQTTEDQNNIESLSLNIKKVAII